MKVAIITPYYKESTDMLMRCHASVLLQKGDHQITHFMVADGFPSPMADKFSSVHVTIPNSADYGDTPRTVGATIAISHGYEALCFLDADNWLEPTHVRNLVQVAEYAEASIVTCPRILRRTDGSFMSVDAESDGVTFNDTNCYLLMRPAFPLIGNWIFKDKANAIVGDRVFWQAVKQSGLKIARSEAATMNYTTTFAFHYQQHNEPIPPDSKLIVQVDGVLKMVKYNEFLEMKENIPCQA